MLSVYKWEKFVQTWQNIFDKGFLEIERKAFTWLILSCQLGTKSRQAICAWGGERTDHYLHAMVNDFVTLLHFL